MSAADWLATKARSCYADARRLESCEEMGGLTGRQWAIVYRAVAEELRNCGREVAQ